MPISLTCHGCGKRLKAKDTLAGRTLPCPACGAKLVIGSADDAAAAMLLDEEAAQADEPDSSPPQGDVALPKRASKPGVSPASPPPPSDRKRPARQAGSTQAEQLKKKSAPIPSAGTLPPLTTDDPPLTTDDPPLWLRHLHWLLVLSLIPLTVSLFQTHDDRDFLRRLIETLEQAPPDSRLRAERAIAELEDGKGSLEKVFAALPDHRLRGAFLPRDTWMHWLFTAGATVLFSAFLFALTLEGSATPHHLFAVGLFTATIGILFLVIVQFVAMWSQGVIIIPRGIIGILFWILQIIGFSYRAAVDPENGFVLSLLGYTFGVGLCEEICKALPVIFYYRRPNNQSWLGAYLFGLASGAGFGLAEGVIYAADFYNGISGPGIYFVRNISCVALHALWTGSAAITVHQRQHLFQEEMHWYDWLVRSLAVVAVPMVLHGLYDTLLKKEMNALALAVAVFSFLYLAFQISRLRGVDDQAAHEAMLKEYQRRRAKMEGH
jgi:RsiW-degrading membrane proteinase PrsW (M82 family)